MSSRKLITLPVLFALAAVLVCVGCSPKAPSENNTAAGDGAKETISVAWSTDMDCGVCHATEQGTYDDQACEASLHADMTCKDCHDDTDTLQTVHEGKTASDKMPKRLKKTNVEDDLCLSCHYETREALIEATEGEVVLTDTEGTSRNPHDPEGVAEHEAIACGDCHNMHSSEDMQDHAMKQCESCHHAGVFECYTCHD